MPYIKQVRRDDLDKIWSPFFSIEGITSGELNYLITSLVKSYLYSKGSPSYEMYNNAIGALENAKLELYRRSVAPYEDTKIKENGDVY